MTFRPWRCFFHANQVRVIICITNVCIQTLSLDISILSLVTSSCTRILFLSCGFFLLQPFLSCNDLFLSQIARLQCHLHATCHLPVCSDVGAPLHPLHALHLTLQTGCGQLVVLLRQWQANDFPQTEASL